MLQQLDSKLSSFSEFGENWPEAHCDNLPTRAYYRSSTWKSNFISFAVSMGMHYYVAETLNDNPGLVNTKLGRPLLHYAVSVSETCRPTLVLDLIEQRANIHAVCVEEGYDKTAIQSILYPASSTASKGSEDIFKAIGYLVQAGADPNTRLFLGETESSSLIGSPLLPHYVTRMPGLASIKMRLCKILVKKGAKTDGLIESFCFVDRAQCSDILI
jgi:hypothetical protein